MVECHLAKVDVEGSNPFSRSTFLVVRDAITTFFTPFVPDFTPRAGRRSSARQPRLSLIPGQLSSASVQGCDQQALLRSALAGSWRAVAISMTLLTAARISSRCAVE